MVAERKAIDVDQAVNVKVVYRNAGIANICTDENLSGSETESEDNSSSDEECITTEIVTDFNEIINSATT